MIITHAFAADNKKLSSYFVGKSGCFLLLNLKENKMVTTYDPDRCSQRISPDSTFKVPLSLMAFDQKIITPQTIFKWDHTDKFLNNWNQDQTPYTWLKNSVVWVSQELTPKLGVNKIKDYLAKFNYGNQDFSGDPGKNNGLTHAWLSSSLKISANEQLTFLKNFAMSKLPISQEAMQNTKENMYLGKSPNGWNLYGKTGSGVSPEDMKQSERNPRVKRDGWFIGLIEKGDKEYVFALNFSDLKPVDLSVAGGTQAKQITQAILAQMGLF